ncbi:MULTISPECIES: polyprenyl synthetase family protein [Actinomadura]|jgi:geranylgeranyl diphosphate synthase type I|uniref:Geranylgeranyl diphosphate synthase type I n=1 Tax=Actinomadura citrea TaxID=46158 RepID=A0A7Y9KGD1_9ACTN|nr:polyprenyl synthetase family protein [Actinomadura citrea]NYE14589.1 geranylgeranyl diphosphate synthase type I [Actinomadura citrea]GGU09642.1 polyprenyl synthetase [Actinomadura citrea]
MADLRTRVDRALAEFVEAEVAELLALDGDLAPVADQLRISVDGGKRIRPAFCYWGWRAAGQPDTDAIVRAAAALELVHAAAIVHDDVIDRSPMRRGRPSAHESLGDALAIMVGDLLVAWSAQLFHSSGLPRAFLGRAVPQWTAMGRELVAGECLEILRTGAAPDVARSLTIVRFKTGSYTVEGPLRIGAVLGGAAAPTLAALAAYARPLGEAFQLRDDLWGVFGDPRRTGKSLLDDLAGRKPTALLALTLTEAGEPDRRRLRDLLDGPLTPAGAAEIREIMLRARAPARVRQMIDERAHAAQAALAGTRPDAADALARLICEVTADD